MMTLASFLVNPAISSLLKKLGRDFEGFIIKIMLTDLRACCSVNLYFSEVFLAWLLSMSSQVSDLVFTLQQGNLFVFFKASVFLVDLLCVNPPLRRINAGLGKCS